MFAPNRGLVTGRYVRAILYRRAAGERFAVEFRVVVNQNRLGYAVQIPAHFGRRRRCRSNLRQHRMLDALSHRERGRGLEPQMKSEDAAGCDINGARQPGLAD